MHNFRELKAWQKARELVAKIYLLSKGFPKEEIYGLSRQMRDCAISISSNIAEGCGRGTNPQFAHFLNIAQGSACELESQLIVAYDLTYISEAELNRIILKVNEVQKMIAGFKKSILT